MASKLLESIGRALAFHESRVELLELKQIEDYIELLEDTKFLKPSHIDQSRKLLKALYKRKFSLSAFENFVCDDGSSKASKSDEMKDLLNLISNDEFRSKASISKQKVFEGSSDIFENTEIQKGYSEDIFSELTCIDTEEIIDETSSNNLTMNYIDFSTIIFDDDIQITEVASSNKHKASDLDLPSSKRFCFSSDETQIDLSFTPDPNFLKTIGFTTEQTQTLTNSSQVQQSINFTEKTLRSQLTEKDWTFDENPDIEKISARIKELLALKDAEIQKFLKKVDELKEIPESEEINGVVYVPYFKKGIDYYSSDSDDYFFHK